MKLNGTERITVCLTTAAILAMCLYPPWELRWRFEGESNQCARQFAPVWMSADEILKAPFLRRIYSDLAEWESWQNAILRADAAVPSEPPDDVKGSREEWRWQARRKQLASDAEHIRTWQKQGAERGVPPKPAWKDDAELVKERECWLGEFDLARYKCPPSGPVSFAELAPPWQYAPPVRLAQPSHAARIFRAATAMAAASRGFSRRKTV